jgi:CheY-like chemotaxis protein
MTTEERLSRLENKIDTILTSIEMPKGTVLLDSYGLCDKLHRSYPVIRSIINKRIIPSPIQFTLTNKELINEKLLDEWLENPENLEKLRKL